MTDVSKGASTTIAAEPGGSKVGFAICLTLEIGQEFFYFLYPYSTPKIATLVYYFF